MDDVKIEWPREIWMAEREDHDQGVVSAVLSEWATVARFEGDVEREKEFHRYVDGDIFDSQDKYWRARLAEVEKERDEQSTLAAVRQARAERAEAALARISLAWPNVRDADCSGDELVASIEEIDAALSTGGNADGA